MNQNTSPDIPKEPVLLKAIFYFGFSALFCFIYYGNPIGPFEVTYEADRWINEMRTPVLESTFDVIIYYTLLTSCWGLFLSFILKTERLALRLIPNLLLTIHTAFMLTLLLMAFYQFFSLSGGMGEVVHFLILFTIYVFFFWVEFEVFKEQILHPLMIHPGKRKPPRQH